MDKVFYIMTIFLYSIQFSFIYKMKDLKSISGSVSNVGHKIIPHVRWVCESFSGSSLISAIDF